MVEALGWIRQFRGRYVVIKLGGSVLDEKDAVRSFLTDVIFLASVGMKPVLVHGGGKSISHVMTAAGIQPRFVQGRRYTDERTLEIVASTLAEICGSLLTELRRQGADAVGLNYLGRNCLIAKKLTLDGPHGESLDLGRVGEVVDVDCSAIEDAARGGADPRHSVDRSRFLGREIERQRRHGGRGGRPVSRSRKARLFERRSGHFSRPQGPRDADFASSCEPLPRFDCRRSH